MKTHVSFDHVLWPASICRVELIRSVLEDLEVREAAEQLELLSRKTDGTEEMLPGRKTGSSQWRAARGEDGPMSTCAKSPELPPGTRFRKIAQCVTSTSQSSKNCT